MSAVTVSLCARTPGESLLHALSSTTSGKTLISVTARTATVSEVLAGLVLCHLGKGRGWSLSVFYVLASLSLPMRLCSHRRGAVGYSSRQPQHQAGNKGSKILPLVCLDGFREGTEHGLVWDGCGCSQQLLPLLWGSSCSATSPCQERGHDCARLCGLL